MNTTNKNSRFQGRKLGRGSEDKGRGNGTMCSGGGCFGSRRSEGMGSRHGWTFKVLICGWDGNKILAKRHDGCEIQLLKGEETHTHLLGRTPFKVKWL